MLHCAQSHSSSNTTNTIIITTRTIICILIIDLRACVGQFPAFPVLEFLNRAMPRLP